MRKKTLSSNKGFTLVEIMVATIMVLFLASSIWAVYWSIVNAYTVEMRGSDLQFEGERIMDLIANGGYYKGYKIYGLNSSFPNNGYPNVGEITSINFAGEDDAADDPYGAGCDGANGAHRADYRIEFCIDPPGVSYPRYAEFAVQLYMCDMASATDTYYSKSALWYRFKDSGNSSNDFTVQISESIAPRRDTSDTSEYGDCDKTWFKAQLLPKDSSGNYYSGIRVSFYLVDLDQPIIYNINLDRKPDPPIDDETQEKSFLGGIPYPRYFSRTIYFPVTME